MSIILLWIVASAAAGWFGRKRVIGFWGFFVLSLVVSPIVTSVFILLAAPGKRYVDETEQRVAAAFRRAGFARPIETRVGAVSLIAAPISYRARIWGVRFLIGAWLAVLVVFAGVYMVMGSGRFTEALGVADALRLSFDVATLGSGGTVVVDRTELAWLAGLERLLVLAILVTLVSSLISAQVAALRAKDQVRDPRTSGPTVEPAARSPISIAQVAEHVPAERSSTH